MILAALVAGGLGAVARFGLSAIVDRRFGTGGTAIVNLTGSFLAGFLAGMALSSGVRLIIVGGGLGGFTTFSTWMLDALGHGSGSAALRHTGWTLLAGLAAAAIGMAAATMAG